MRCTEWRDWSVNFLLTIQTRLQLQALHLHDGALQQWEAAAARVAKTIKGAQDTTTAAVASLSEAAVTFAARVTTTRALLHHQALHLHNGALQQWETAVARMAKAFKDTHDTTIAAVTSFSDAATAFAARMTTTISSSAVFALSQLQAWGPSILGVFLLALAVLVAWKVHVATDGAIVAWMNKSIRYLAPRVVAWLHWLLIWAVYALDCVAEGVLDFIVAPSVLVLAGSIVPVATLFVCAFISLAFPRWVKPNHEEEKKKEGIFLLGWIDELVQLPGLFLPLAYYSVMLAVSTMWAGVLAVVNGNEVAREASHREFVMLLPSDNPNMMTTAEATATMAVATATEKLSMGTRIVRFWTSKSTTAAPRRAPSCLAKSLHGKDVDAAPAPYLLRRHPRATDTDGKRCHPGDWAHPIGILVCGVGTTGGTRSVHVDGAAAGEPRGGEGGGGDDGGGWLLSVLGSPTRQPAFALVFWD